MAFAGFGRVAGAESSKPRLKAACCLKCLSGGFEDSAPAIPLSFLKVSGESIAPVAKRVARIPTILHLLVGSDYTLDLRDSKGGDIDEWPTDLRIREFPAALAIA